MRKPCAIMSDNNTLYPRLPDYARAAERTAEPWRLAIGIIAIAALYLFLAWNFAAAVWPLVVDAQGQPLATILRLLNVSLMGLAVICVTKLLHNRAARTLLGHPGLALVQFMRVLRLQIPVLACLGLVLVLTAPGDIVPNTPFSHWIALFLPGLAAVFLQSSAEEIAFRGYLLQQLAARFRSPAIWMGVSSALFGLAHYAPEYYAGNAGVIVIWALCFGVAMADLTARSGTLGPAIAVHFAVNNWSLLFVALPGDLSGLALFVLPFGPDDEAKLAGLFPAEFLSILISWLTARLALRL